MNDASENYQIFPPERFTGEIVFADQRIAVGLTASADQSGRLALEVEPISVSGSSGGALKLMKSCSRPGNTVDEFRLECESSDGKRLTSDQAYLAGYSHNSEDLNIQLCTAKARLSMKAQETQSRPALSFSLLGFKCFPKVHTEANLGTVCVRGATRTTATNKITGDIAVQAREENTTTNWRQEAEQLLMHLRLVLGFARGSPLSVPIMEFFEGDHVDVTFYETGGGNLSEMPPLSYLNLAPIVTKAAVAHVELVEKDWETLGIAVGWLLVPTTYDEVRFITGMTALESLASRSSEEPQKFVLLEPEWKKFKKLVKAFVDEQEQLDDSARKAIKGKIGDLNRRSFRSKIVALFEHWGIARTLLDDEVLNCLVRLRNEIVHQGGAPEGEDFWPSILTVREILVRLVLAMLQFDGTYQCYVGGRHMRHFPSCEPVS